HAGKTKRDSNKRVPTPGRMPEKIRQRSDSFAGIATFPGSSLGFHPRFRLMQKESDWHGKNDGGSTGKENKPPARITMIKIRLPGTYPCAEQRAGDVTESRKRLHNPKRERANVF